MSEQRGVPALRREGELALGAFLLFIGFPLSQLLSAPPGALRTALVLAGLALFVGVYLWLMLRPAELIRAPVEWLALALVVALAVALSVDDSAEWSMLLIYVGAICGFRLRGWRSLAAIALCAGGAGALGWQAGYPVDDSISYVLYAFAIGLMLRAFAQLAIMNAALRAARLEIARLAVADERARFARDLHDLLGHSLSLIALKTELAGRLLEEQPERAAAELADVEQVTRESLREVRDAVSGYRRPTLAGELAGARVALGAAGIDVDVEQGAPPLPAETDALLAWALREGVTNVVRHSAARRCRIRIGASRSAAELEVDDDGVGADGQGGGNGLAGLRERARGCNGVVEAGARPGGGFRLRVRVPCP